jgi:DNA-3-methyladenine glycosylase I
MRTYYEKEWGRLIDDDERFFEFLCLEIFQAGLSWETIVKKRDGMRHALDGFDFTRIARYDDAMIERLCSDVRVIRHRMKLEAIRSNAQVFSEIIDEHGSFLVWLTKNGQDSLEDWIVLFRRTFSFMGPEIVREFLESAGVIDTEGKRILHS